MENQFEEERRLYRARKKVQSIKGFYKHLAIYVFVNGFLLALKWFKLEEGEEFFTFSTFTTAFFWGFGLVFHAIGVFGTNLFMGSDWEERKVQEYMNRDKNKSSKWE